MTKVCILYGFCEGPGVAKTLLRLIRQNGFIITADSEDADIIVAHSGGYLYVPANTTGKTIFIFNASCGSLGLLPLRMTAKMWLQFVWYARHRELRGWVQKSWYNAWYIFAQCARNIDMLRRIIASKGRLPTLAAKRITVINNHYDPWSHSIPKSDIEQNVSYVFVTYPGPHDDLWVHPGRYLPLICNKTV